jgi:hypothetical protein
MRAEDWEEEPCPAELPALEPVTGRDPGALGRSFSRPSADGPELGLKADSRKSLKEIARRLSGNGDRLRRRGEPATIAPFSEVTGGRARKEVVLGAPEVNAVAIDGGCWFGFWCDIRCCKRVFWSRQPCFWSTSRWRSL